MSQPPLRDLPAHGRANNETLVITGPIRRQAIIELEPVIKGLDKGT
jgi:hypothetical protein